MGSRYRLTEKRCLILLLILFSLSSAFILSFHHSFENPTVPDERAYYGWARLFNRGYMAVPLEDWYGMNPQAPSSRVDLMVNGTGIHFLRMESEVLNLDSVGGENDISVQVMWQDGSPVPGALVRVWLEPPLQPLLASTDDSGLVQFLNVPPGLRPLGASFSRPQPPSTPPIDLHVTDLIAIEREGEPYRTFLVVDSYSPTGGEVTVRASDSFDMPIEGVNVSLRLRASADSEAIASELTDSDGRATFTLAGEGSYVLMGEKEGLGEGIIGPSVVSVDSRYYVVNRWPPGYQILLALFLRLTIEELTTLFLMAVASSATYALARRLFGWRAAFLATVLLMTCAVALILIFEVGMADYASMTFALLGISFFFEALGRESRRGLPSVLFLSSGLALAVAVWMRYSTGTVVLVPLIYLLVLAFKEGRDERGGFLPTRASIGRGFRRAALLVLGLLVLGLPLALYNSTYFGSPIAAGYNYGSLSIQGEGENTTAEITRGSFFENFNPAASLSTIPMRLYYLLALIPFAYLIPLAIWRRSRDLAVWFLVGAFLANFLLYIFVPWVASWPDVTRSMEDMRYFLPSVPPAAILSGLFLRDLWERWGWKRILGMTLTVILVIAGFSVATVGIGLQLQRLNRQPPPPPPPLSAHRLVSVQQLYDDPLAYNGTPVEVRDCTVLFWADPTLFVVREDVSHLDIGIQLLDYEAPKLGPGDLVSVKGMFRWFDGNDDGIAQPPEMRIGVKGGTQDRIVKL
ncbi:MAG: hypothetical protein ACE5HJ_06530 [Thermoplasmata archaeon]